MQTERKPQTAELNGTLWGTQAHDWANIQEGCCRPVFLSVFERTGLGSGTSYLDVGCGAGLAAHIASERGARVSGLDAAENLLAVARERVPGAEFHVGELESLPFSDDSFDLVTGFNSVQYAGNPGVALKEAGRVARPGAAVAIATWGKPEGMEAAAVVTALKPLLPPPPPGAPGPFALSDEAVLRDFASAAGLTPIEVHDVRAPFEYPDRATAMRGLKSAGVVARAIQHSGEAAVDAAYAGVLEPYGRPDGSYRINAEFRYLIARA